MERNPGMSLRMGDATVGYRIDAINEDSMCKHFDLLEEVYKELDFKDHPEMIYNIDKTGMPLDPQSLLRKKVHYRCSSQKS